MYRIEILNWKKYQPELDDDIKRTWVRIEKAIGRSCVRAMGFEARWIFLILVCLAEPGDGQNGIWQGTKGLLRDEAGVFSFKFDLDKRLGEMCAPGGRKEDALIRVIESPALKTTGVGLSVSVSRPREYTESPPIKTTGIPREYHGNRKAKNMPQTHVPVVESNNISNSNLTEQEHSFAVFSEIDLDPGWDNWPGDEPQEIKDPAEENVPVQPTLPTIKPKVRRVKKSEVDDFVYGAFQANIWSLEPRHTNDNKKAGFKAVKKTMLDHPNLTIEDLARARREYLTLQIAKEERGEKPYLNYLSTFYGPNEHWNKDWGAELTKWLSSQKNGGKVSVQPAIPQDLTPIGPPDQEAFSEKNRLLYEQDLAAARKRESQRRKPQC